tara:strand:+ start:408 stop:818 length:411 start_codon:yes stop_codon:yes gene_type:complete
MLNKEPIPRVWINGTFDVIHSGHIKLFRYARMLAGSKGQVIVGLDTDDRIKLSKGPTRPVNNLINRIIVLSSIKYIDQIMSFSTDDELESLIYNIKPRFMVIGDDYINKPIIGSEHISNIYYVTRDGNSTTNTINR